jgi:hypothetical protein
MCATLQKTIQKFGRGKNTHFFLVRSMKSKQAETEERRNIISKTLMKDLSTSGLKIEDYFSKFEAEFKLNASREDSNPSTEKVANTKL